MTSRCSVFLSILACLSPVCASAQSIVSAHSGVIHFFEGSVSIDGQILEQKFGRFDELKCGSELRTERGRAEVLLTPGVLLRVDENTSIRMVSNKLADTRLELIGGAAALDSRNAAPGAPVLIAYQDYRMRFARSGRYRFDSAPAQLRVDEGEADVLLRDKSVTVKAGQVLPFSAPLTARAAGNPSEDGLDRWDQDRSASISAGNASAAASDDLSSALNDPQSGSDGSGYSGGLLPDPIGGGSYGSSFLSPLGLYASPGFRFGYIPFYLRMPVYRPLPIRTGILRVPVRTYAPSRTAASPPTRLAPRPVLPSTIHR
jgi:hypothetical protein